MFLGKRIKNPKVIIHLGLIAMVLAGPMLSLHRVFPGLSENITDGITGLFYGVAITTLLLGVRLNSRHRSTPGDGCCE